MTRDDAGRFEWQSVAPVAGLFLLSTAAAAYEIAPASVFPLVRASLDVGPAAAGWLVSVMYATAVVASVPVGVTLERVETRRAVTAAGVAVLVAGAWGYWAAVSGAFLSLLASRALGGLAYVLVWNAGASVAGEVVSPEVRATAVGAFTASAPVGFALGQFGSPLVAAALGWPATLPAFAAIAAVGVAVFLASTRGDALDADTAAPDRDGVLAVFADRGVWTLGGLCFLSFSLYIFLNTWLPSYLTQEAGVSLAVAGSLTALFPAVGVVSRTTSGVLSDRVFDGRRRPVAVLAFVVAAPAFGAFAFVADLAVVVALVAAAGFGVQLALGLLFSYVAEVVPSDVRATAVSLLMSVGLLGAVVAPVAAGVIIDRAGYPTAFLAAFGVAVAGVALAWRAPAVADAD